MKDIQVGDRVRIVDNPNVPKHLRNQLGTVIPIPTGVTTGEDEVMVKLDKGGKLFFRKHDLTKVPKPLDG